MGTPWLARVTALWPAAVVAVTAATAVVFDPRGRWAFPPPKEAVLVAGAAAGLFLALVDWALRPARRGREDLDRPLVAAAAGCVLWWCAAPLVVAANPALHLNCGSRVLATVALGALTAAAVVRHGRRWAAAFEATLGVLGIGVAAVAVLQACGVDPLALVAGMSVQASGRWRIISTAGHPSWAGELVAATAPYALALAWRWRAASSGRRVAAGLAASCTWLLALGAVVATGSRLALVALVVGSVTWLGVEMSSSGRSFRRAAALGGAGLALVVGLFGGPLIERLTESDPLHGRAALAGAAAVLVAESPVVGHGVGHVQVCLPGGLVKIGETLPEGWRPRTLVDRIDNDFLQIGVEGGLPAAMLLVAVWGLAVRRSLCVRHAAAGGSLVALAAAAAGSAPLHTPATAVVFWVGVGVVAACPLAADRAEPVGRRLPRALPVAAVMAAAFLAALAAAHGWTVVTANREAARARSAFRGGDLDRAEELYRQVVERAPWDHHSRVGLAEALIAQGDHAEGLAVIRNAQQWCASQRAWLLQAQALAATGRLDDAVGVLEQAVSTVPEARAALVGLGELYLAQGRPEPAAAVFRRALTSRQRAPNADEFDERARAGLIRVREAPGGR